MVLPPCSSGNSDLVLPWAMWEQGLPMSIGVLINKLRLLLSTARCVRMVVMHPSIQSPHQVHDRKVSDLQAQ